MWSAKLQASESAPAAFGPARLQTSESICAALRFGCWVAGM